MSTAQGIPQRWGSAAVIVTYAFQDQPDAAAGLYPATAVHEMIEGHLLTPQMREVIPLDNTLLVAFLPSGLISRHLYAETGVLWMCVAVSLVALTDEGVVRQFEARRGA